MPHKFRTLIVPGLILLVALVISQTFWLNSFDWEILSDGTREFFNGQNPYTVTGYFSPPHMPLVGFPTILGVRFNALLNAAFLLYVLGGGKTNWLFVLFSPFFVISIGEGNIFFVTCLGLLIIFSERKGVLRGLAWAMLTCRPQDALLVAGYDGFRALRHRDWRAIITATILVVPPFILHGIDWLHTLAEVGNSSVEYTLSIRENAGYLVAIVFAIGIVSARFVEATSHTMVIRTWTRMPRSEQAWILMAVGWILVAPYVTIYQITYSLLLLRPLDLSQRSHRIWGALIACSLYAIFFLFFSTPRGFEDNLWQTGFSLALFVLATCTPRVNNVLPELKNLPAKKRLIIPLR